MPSYSEVTGVSIKRAPKMDRRVKESVQKLLSDPFDPNTKYFNESNFSEFYSVKITGINAIVKSSTHRDLEYAIFIENPSHPMTVHKENIGFSFHRPGSMTITANGTSLFVALQGTTFKLGGQVCSIPMASNSSMSGDKLFPSIRLSRSLNSDERNSVCQLFKDREIPCFVSDHLNTYNESNHYSQTVVTFRTIPNCLIDDNGIAIRYLWPKGQKKPLLFFYDDQIINDLNKPDFNKSLKPLASDLQVGAKPKKGMKKGVKDKKGVKRSVSTSFDVPPAVDVSQPRISPPPLEEYKASPFVASDDFQLVDSSLVSPAFHFKTDTAVSNFYEPLLSLVDDSDDESENYVSPSLILSSTSIAQNSKCVSLAAVSHSQQSVFTPSPDFFEAISSGCHDLSDPPISKQLKHVVRDSSMSITLGLYHSLLRFMVTHNHMHMRHDQSYLATMHTLLGENFSSDIQANIAFVFGKNDLFGNDCSNYCSYGLSDLLLRVLAPSVYHDDYSVQYFTHHPVFRTKLYSFLSDWSIYLLLLNDVFLDQFKIVTSMDLHHHFDFVRANPPCARSQLFDRAKSSLDPSPNTVNPPLSPSKGGLSK